MARAKKKAKQAGVPNGTTLPEIACEAIGATRLGELLFYTPKRYEDLSNVEQDGGVRRSVGRKVVLRVRVTKAPWVVSEMPKRFSVGLTDGRDELTLNEFGSITNRPLGKLRVGDEVLLHGEVREWRSGGKQFVLENAKDVTHEERCIIPVYRSIRGKVTGLEMRELIHSALGDLEAAVDRLRGAFDGHSDESLLCAANRGLPERLHLGSLGQIFVDLHRPVTVERMECARLAAKNLTLFETFEKARKSTFRPDTTASVIEIPGQLVADLSRTLPYPLTEDQKTVTREIWRDLRSPRPMARVLSGEVGSGKSTPMALLAAAVHLVGRRAVLLFPNEPLAHQVAGDIVKWFPQVKLRMVTGESKPPITAVREENAILAGTTAVLSYMEKHGLEADFFVADEQQKLGAAQRGALVKAHTNYLEATATCLPRTGALIAYGGMACSILREQPVKKHITTHLVSMRQANAMMMRIRQAIAAGGRVAVVLPAVEPGKEMREAPLRERERQVRRSVTTAMDLFEAAFPGRVVGVHGRMKADAKTEAIEKVKRGEADVIVATSLIEVGITIPRLMVAVVVDPHQMGLSTLHQLRGRLVRDGGRGMFFLYPTEEISEAARVRLKTLERCSDGFELAEADLKARGFGDLGEDGELQSGAGVVLFRGLEVFPADVERMLDGEQTSRPGTGQGAAVA